MGDKQGSFRTTISVPGDLKARMDRVEEPVNWSALACRAFEDKLAEIATRKESKAMADVVERLRASLRSEQGASFNEGYKAGRWWAENLAAAAELTRLQMFKERTRTDPHPYWQSDFWEEYRNPRWVALVGEIQNNKHLCPLTAQAFWSNVLGEKTQQDHDGNFYRGFVEGAVDLWAKVREQL